MPDVFIYHVVVGVLVALAGVLALIGLVGLVHRAWSSRGHRHTGPAPSAAPPAPRATAAP